MEQQIEIIEWSIQRLRELRADHAEGEAQLLQIERHRAQVHDGLLRLTGAIQALEEVIAASGAFDEHRAVATT